MKRLFLVTAGLAIVTSCGMRPAFAADLAVKAPQYAPSPAYSWTGISIEGFGSYGVNFGETNVFMPGAQIDLATTPHGPGFGGGLEALYQISPLVVIGARAQIGYANLQGSGALNVQGVNQLSVTNATNYLFNLDGVVGLVLTPRLLAYGAAGLGGGGAKPDFSALGTSKAISDTSLGYNVGAGFRYALDDHWSVKLEGDYYGLGGKQISLTDSAGVVTMTSATKIKVFQQLFGFEYKIF
jgi:outer membrane immunogenic protein